MRICSAFLKIFIPEVPLSHYGHIGNSTRSGDACVAPPQSFRPSIRWLGIAFVHVPIILTDLMFPSIL